MKKYSILLLISLVTFQSYAQELAQYILLFKFKEGKEKEFVQERTEKLTGLKLKISDQPAYKSGKTEKKLPESPAGVWLESAPVQENELLKKIRSAMNTGLFEQAEYRVQDQMLINPNDPLADSALADSVIKGLSSKLSQFYLHKIKAYQAWDVEKGDTNVSIAVVDFSFDISHEDLVGNVQYNKADTLDGLDNDSDGLIDNYAGWNVAGNNNNLLAAGIPHGNIASGACSATPNNGKGLAGTGFNCRFYPIRIGGSSAYSGITFAANRNLPVINLSWGQGLKTGKNPTAAEQNIINQAAIDSDAVIVASAGNSSNQQTDYFYPASYDHVLSVAQTTVDDKVNTSSTYSLRVDVCIPNRYSATLSASGYTSDGTYSDGSSVSAPVVAGAVGLIRSKYPLLNALQAAERIRRTCDVIDTLPGNENFKGMMGYGRLNMYRALSETGLQSIRMYRRIADTVNAHTGDTLPLKFEWISLLDPIQNARITLQSLNPNFVPIDSVWMPGNLATLQKTDNIGSPLTLRRPALTLSEARVPLRFNYSGNNGFEYYQNILVPFYHNSSVTTDSCKLKLTQFSGGRTGYNDVSLLNILYGKGIVYEGKQLIFDGGLVVGSSASKLSSNIRTAGVNKDDDFYMSSFRPINEPLVSQAFESKFNDSASTAMIGLDFSQKLYAGIPGDTGSQFVLLQYDVTNNSGAQIDTLFMGLFSGWDIDNLYNNRFIWDSTNHTGYVKNNLADSVLAGVALLWPTNFSTYYGFDWGAPVDGIDLTNGVTKEEKFKLINGKFKKEAGLAGNGSDVDGYVGGAITDFKAGETKTIIFAYVAGKTKAQLDSAVGQAKMLSRKINTSTAPAVADTVFCTEKGINISFDDPALFDVYDTVPGFRPALATKISSYSTVPLAAPVKLFLTGSDKLFVSDTVAIVFDTSKASISFTASQTSNLTVDFEPLYVSQVIAWDFGDGQTSGASNPTHTYNSDGIYTVTLTALDTHGCSKAIDHEVVVMSLANPGASYSGTGCKVYPNPSNGVFNMSCTESGEIKAVLQDVCGRKIFSKETFTGSGDIHTFELQHSGIYILTVDHNGNKSVHKVVINP